MLVNEAEHFENSAKRKKIRKGQRIPIFQHRAVRAVRDRIKYRMKGKFSERADCCVNLESRAQAWNLESFGARLTSFACTRDRGIRTRALDMHNRKSAYGGRFARFIGTDRNALIWNVRFRARGGNARAGCARASRQLASRGKVNK